MKKLLIGALLLSQLLLVSCSDNNKEKIVNMPINMAGENGKIINDYKIEMLFKANSEIPYISLNEGIDFLSKLRKEYKSSNSYYKLESNLNKATIKNEIGDSCIIDYDNQTITFSDFDSLLSNNESGNLSLLNLKPFKKTFKITKSNYTKGNELKVDLNSYKSLDIYKYNDKLYLPLSVFNSFFVNVHILSNLAYNFNGLFFACTDDLYEEDGDSTTLTNLGALFYNTEKKDEISLEFTNYYYDSLLIELNYLYGLKKDKNIESFDKFFIDYGYKNDVLSKNVIKMDNATVYTLSNLNDFHTAILKPSFLYDFKRMSIDSTKYSKETIEFHKIQDELNKYIKSYGIEDGIENIDNTLFISFNSFQAINENELYNYGDKPTLTNTATLFNYAYKYVLKNKDIKNIVVDLTYNIGGSSDALLYSLSTLIGDVSFCIENPVTSSYNNQTYKVDINLDSKIDENDKSLKELGYNIIFLNSAHSFSSANAMPYLAKYNDSSVITMGEKTAGGACISKPTITPIGSIYSLSGLMSISTLKDGKIVNVDKGIEADYKIERKDFYNRKNIVNYINNNIFKK